MPRNRVLVSKWNMIIPRIEENLDRGNFSMEMVIPCICPCCGQSTHIHENNGTKTLFCGNKACETRLLRAVRAFCQPEAIDIEGRSEVTMEKFIGRD